jgi:hypothetical protein
MQLPYEPHPANLAFRFITGDSWKRFVADVKARGQIEDIILGRGPKPRTKLILDGKNLLRACLELELEPRYRDYDGDDQVGFIVGRNLHRRHDNESQRAIAARRLAMLPVGRPSKSRRSAELSQREAAHMLDVGERSVQRAGVVLKRGVPELVQAVEEGELAIDTAAALAKLPKAEQRKQVAAAAAGANVREVVRDENRLSVAMRLTDSDIKSLKALADLGHRSTDWLARAGAVVLRRIVPTIGAK